MSQLDALIERARSATVDRAAAEQFVDELERWARPRQVPERRWAPWLAACTAVAAIAVVVWAVGRDPLRAVPTGPRVAIVPDPETSYRIVRSGPADTTIAVDRGTVTARLWPGAAPYQLALVGGGVTATAVGTVYSLAVDAHGATVHVVEGTVSVRAPDGVHLVHAGGTWPDAHPPGNPAAGRLLLALPAPSAGSAGSAPEPAVELVDAAPAPAEAAVAGPGDAADDGALDAGGLAETPPDASRAAPVAAGSAHPPEPSPSVKDRWRTARLLRGQGKFDAAVVECLAIADARDPMWSPIALIEAVRIELGPLADLDRAVALAERFLREWPRDPLAAEARELRCRALRQLGRDSECAAAPRAP